MLLFESDEFRMLSPTSLRESEYEVLLQQSRGNLFPGLAFCPFKVDIGDGVQTKRADFALVDLEYRAWWVVEAELSHHSRTHVEEQLNVFANGMYGPKHAAALANAASGDTMDPDRLSDLVLSQQPKVSVIVHGHESQTESWREGISLLGAQLAHVNVYRSTRNKHALVVVGDLPSSSDLPSVGRGSSCSRSIISPKWIRIESPAILRVSDSQQVEIEIQGDVTLWQRRDMAGSVALVPVVGDPLLRYEVSKTFSLVPKHDNRFTLEEH